jgi:RecA-family ATPase
MISGEGGTGKSILLLQLCVATVLGCAWIDLQPEPGAALYLGAEDEADELRRRLTDVAHHYCGKFSAMRDKLFITSYAGNDATLARFDRQNRIEPTTLYKRLLKQACDIHPKIIVLDTLSDIFAGNENDRVQTGAFLGLMRGLAITANCAVIISSHPSLQGMNSGSGLSGSTGWHGKVRSRMYFRPAKEKDGEDLDPDLRVLEFKKNQYGRLGESILLRWNSGVFIAEPTVGSMEQQIAEHRLDELFMTLLERFTLDGRKVSHKKSSTYAPAKFAEEREAKSIKANPKALEAAMLRLFAAGKIKVIEDGPPSHRRSRIVIAGAV